MSTAGFSHEELQLRKKLLMEELQQTTNQILERNVVEGSMDIHHPERSPGWKPYKFQEYPKIMYHPVKLDPTREDQRRSIVLRNQANPNLAPLDQLAPEPMKRKVNSKAEEEQAAKEGFVTTPPILTLVEEGQPVRSADPLAESMGVQPQKRRA